MRIGFIGKGGSGKTSISSAFALFLAQNQEVLFIDADVNAHAHECFDLKPSKPLGESLSYVSSYLAGERKDILSSQMIGSTPPTKGSKLVKNLSSDSFIASLSKRKDKIALITVGTYTKEDSGINCYHSKLMPLEMLLHHTVDNKNEYLIMDATAGVDLLGTSLFMAFDILFFIIEPTSKSISVLQTFMNQCESRVIPILNKVKSDKDIDFIKSQGIDPIIIIKESDSLRLFEQGDKEQFKQFRNENAHNFEYVLREAKKFSRDYSEYYEKLLPIYKKSCESWYNKYFETDIYEKTEIDLDFLKKIGGSNE